MPHLLGFDLDDTLAPSKSPIDPSMAVQLLALLDKVPVCIISGGQFEQFKVQVVDQLGGATPSQLERLYLMPTCGTQHYRFLGGQWQRLYAEALTDDETYRAMAALKRAAEDLGFWEEDPWGPALEDRGTQVTYSALGQEAPVDVKSKWDPSGEKKTLLREAVAEELPDLEVRAGGTTSIDVTRKGVDKAFGMRRLREVTGIAFDDMLYLGDKLDPSGNDYPVKALGVPVHAVTSWQDTAAFLAALVPELPFVATPVLA